MVGGTLCSFISIRLFHWQNNRLDFRTSPEKKQNNFPPFPLILHTNYLQWDPKVNDTKGRGVSKLDDLKSTKVYQCLCTRCMVDMGCSPRNNRHMNHNAKWKFCLFHILLLLCNSSIFSKARCSVRHISVKSVLRY